MSHASKNWAYPLRATNENLLYKITKLVSDKYQGATDTPIINKQGRLEARRADHFRDFLNRPPPTIEAEVHYPATDLVFCTASLEKKGNHSSHQIPQKRKNPGTGQPQRRTLQGRARVCSTSCLATLFSNIGGQKVPDDWTEGAVKIPKKGP